jgi:stress-induced-phosphoprotein 1
MFGGADVWAKLAANPKTAPMLANPQMVNKIKMLQANPQMMSSFIQDPQMMTVISVMLGIDLAGAPGGDESPFGAAPPAAASKSQSTSSGVVVESDSDDEEVVKPAAKPAAAPTPAPAAAAPAKRDEPKTAGPAEQAKNAGNELYKKRQFDEAIEQYNKAISLDASNPNFLLNRAAARFEQKQYDQCIADCQAAADLAQEHHTPDTPAVLGKAYARMANSFAKQIKYEDAIKYYRKSLLEVGSNDVRSKLKEVEEAKKKKEQEDYIDPVKSAEANELGKQAFTAGKWPEAVAHYSEAIKRNPKDAKLYSNRAACYTKLVRFFFFLFFFCVLNLNSKH